jgi:hypothetical protein
VFSVAYLGSGLLAPDTVAGLYNASAYWVSYRDGFVRRGLPGAVMEAVLGGPPGLAAASVVAILLVLLVLAALAQLVRMTVRAVPAPRDRLVVGALVAASPFTFSLAVLNRGRYDAVVVACVVLVAVLASGRSTRGARVVGIAVAVPAGVGSLEIAVAFLAPLAVLAVLRLARTRAERLTWSALVVLPGSVLAAASLWVRPGVDRLVAMMGRVAEAGLPVTPADENSISALGQTTRDALAHTAGIAPLTVLFCAAVLGGSYALTTYVLWGLLGRPRARWTLFLAAVYAVAALTMSAVGDDYRRWWGFAFVAMAASLVLLRQGAVHVPAPRHVHEPPSQRLLVVTLLISAALQVFPIWPSWDPSQTAASIEQIQR